MQKEGFERLVREHKDRVYSYAAWMLRDLEEARDVTQETLVRLWRNLPKVEEKSARSWLLRTTHNLCIDRKRRQQVRPQTAADGETEPNPDPGPGPERLARSTQTGEAIGHALAVLGEQDRAVVLLREVEGMPYDQIARTLNLPLGTVKAKLHRARERLRQELIGAGVTP